MKIALPDRLVTAFQREYPNCIRDADSMGEMAETILWQWLAMNGRTRVILAEHPAEPSPQPSNCCCDYSNHCPEHGSRPIPKHLKHAYINSP